MCVGGRLAALSVVLALLAGARLSVGDAGAERVASVASLLVLNVHVDARKPISLAVPSE